MLMNAENFAAVERRVTVLESTVKNMQATLDAINKNLALYQGNVDTVAKGMADAVAVVHQSTADLRTMIGNAATPAPAAPAAAMPPSEP